MNKKPYSDDQLANQITLIAATRNTLETLEGYLGTMRQANYLWQKAQEKIAAQKLTLTKYRVLKALCNPDTYIHSYYSYSHHTDKYQIHNSTVLVNANTFHSLHTADYLVKMPDSKYSNIKWTITESGKQAVTDYEAKQSES